MNARVVYQHADGRQLTTNDLHTSWENRPSPAIPPEAHELHKLGRSAGENGQLRKAIDFFMRAHELAPGWAYPVYDTAFTYLLLDDMTKSEECYVTVDRLEPRGFFT